MNIVHSGEVYHIYGEEVKTYDKLPVGTYKVNFNKFAGFFLSDHSDLTVSEEKIYGSSQLKVDKVLRSFQNIDRNFGVILSGKKGIGKSLFARQLAVRSKDYGLPLIIVDGYVSGIANFIASIKQEVVVLFDEFEKTFADGDECKPQEEMLSLFDGVDDGKKLFVITCNEVAKLNDYLINRPGRFHYHFILQNPNREEIREYLEDKLEEQYYPVIKKVIGFSMVVDLTYDILRAIAFELNMGYSFEETIMDLNIGKECAPRYDITVMLEDGTRFIANNERVDIYTTEYRYLWLNSVRGKPVLRIGFVPSDISVDIYRAGMTLAPEKVTKYIDEDYCDNDDEYEKLCNTKIVSVSLTKNTSNELAHKYLI